MFSSKIKTAANHLGVDLRFSRSVDGAIETMRKNPTSMVIFDLNNERIAPLAIVGAMQQDPTLAAIPTVGFASHVHTDIINGPGRPRRRGAAAIGVRAAAQRNPQAKRLTVPCLPCR